MSRAALLQYQYENSCGSVSNTSHLPSRNVTAILPYWRMAQQGVRPDGLNMVQETRIEDALRDIRRIADNSPTHIPWEQRLRIARTAIAAFDSTGFTQLPNRTDDRIFVVTELQKLAYHDTEGAGVTDIAEWCMNQWLFILQRNAENLAALRGWSTAYQSYDRFLHNDRTGASLVSSISKRACENPSNRRQFLQRQQWSTSKPERQIRILIVGRSPGC